MPLTSSRRYLVPLFLAVAMCSAVSACAQRPRVAVRRPVALWVVGDDALTLKVRDALEHALESSRRLSLAGSQPPSLVMTIPSNVRWNAEGTRIRVLYTVKLSIPNGAELEARSGSCWSDHCEVCASEIVRWAEAVAEKRPVHSD